MNRRRLLIGGLAGPLALALPGSAAAESGPGGYGRRRAGGAEIPIGDMHAHLFFIGPSPAHRRPLGPLMAAGGASLVAWSLVGDMPWLGKGLKGFTQKGAPTPGAATAWLDDELARIKAHVAEQGLGIVAAPSDLAKAVAGTPHVVLAVEGATFLDDGIASLAKAHAMGVRHVQLVHYIRNTIGDFQTERPRHGGLTAFGRDVVAECNRLGILIDLAHCTEEAVAQALDISKAPMVWSHGSVTKDRPSWQQAAWQARKLPLETARAIAGKGGVVGLWGLGSDVGRTVESYAERLLEMAGWLGDAHVAFGSDMNALAATPIDSYAALRRVVDHLARRGVPEAQLRNIAIANYARVLEQAMAAGRA